MSRRMQVLAGIGALTLLIAGAVPIHQAVDRALPHAIELWDTDQCGPASTGDHALFGMAAPVLQPGHADVTILEARPLGVSPGARWRTWVAPIAAGSNPTGGLGTSAPPRGWPDREAAAGATVSSRDAAELDLEIWPGPGQSRTSVRGFLVTYRTTLGLVRTVRTPTDLTTRVGGCA